jgi:hypothetical protein
MDSGGKRGASRVSPVIELLRQMKTITAWSVVRQNVIQREYPLKSATFKKMKLSPR